jgi:long-chain fatty acid transport protein
VTHTGIARILRPVSKAGSPRRVLLVLATAAGAAVAFPSSGHASGFDLPQVGTSQSGPVSRDAAALHHNPAQLGYLSRAEILIGAGVVVANVGYERDYRGPYQLSDTLQFDDPIDAAYLDPNKGGLADPVSTNPVGPAGGLFVGIPLVENRLGLGIGASVPYAAILDFPDEGAQKFQIREAFVTGANISAGLGVQLHKVVSLGASVSYALTFLELSKVQDLAGVDFFHDALQEPPVNQPNDFGVNAPSTVRELDVLARPIWIEDAVSHGVTFNAGLALRPTDRLDLAVVYHHSSRVRANGKFTLDFNDDFFTQDLAAEGLQYPPVVEGDALVEFTFPNRLTVGAGYDISSKFRLDGFASYVFYRTVDAFLITTESPDLEQPELGVPGKTTQVLPREWTDVVNIEINGRIRPTDALLLSVTLGYNSPASPDSTVDAASPDGHRLIWGLGFGYTFKDRFQLLADAKFHNMIPRNVTQSRHDLGNGTYRLFIAQIGLAGRILFDFSGAKPASRKSAPAQPAPTVEN